MNRLFGWSYPPGAASDPYAPYNQDEQPVQLDGCGYAEFPTDVSVYWHSDGGIEAQQYGPDGYPSRTWKVGSHDWDDNLSGEENCRLAAIEALRILNTEIEE